jgi:branched-chain amino acid transport system ATP-binding protein
MTAKVLLEASELRAGFGSNTVLHGVSFRVHEGEIAAILGLNGAGKSVTLKVVGGVVPAWKGRITFAGEDITRLGAEQRVERGMAHVPQGRQVFPELTVEQNLRLGAYSLRRRDKSRYTEVLESVLDRFPILGTRRRQPAGTLSGGEQAMLAVGRALMCEPQLILVDEASAGLAPIVVRQLFDMLREVNRSGVTILLVEQNVTFSLNIADRAHIMQHGRIVYEGDVPSLDTDKVATYLGVGRLLGRGVTDAVRRRGAKRPVPRKRKATKRKVPKR